MQDIADRVRLRIYLRSRDVGYHCCKWGIVWLLGVTFTETHMHTPFCIDVPSITWKISSLTDFWVTFIMPSTWIAFTSQTRVHRRNASEATYFTLDRMPTLNGVSMIYYSRLLEHIQKLHHWAKHIEITIQTMDGFANIWSMQEMQAFKIERGCRSEIFWGNVLMQCFWFHYFYFLNWGTKNAIDMELGESVKF